MPRVSLRPRYRGLSSGDEIARDSNISRLALLFLGPVSVIAIFSHLLAPGLSVCVPFALLAFVTMSLRIRGRLSDPVIIMGIVLILYTLPPYFGDPGASPLLLAYGPEGGFLVHNLAITGYFAGVALVARTLPLSGRSAGAAVFSVPQTLLAATIGSALSILLSAIYVAKFGFVIGGDVEYSEGFVARMSAGAGILLLAVPFALGSLALTLTARKPILSIYTIPPLIAFAALFVAEGQRKFFIIPLLCIAFARIRVRSSLVILLVLVGTLLAWIIFCYLGFLRFMNISLSSAFDPAVFGMFWSYSDEFLAGETLALHGTASAAYVGVIDPLPWGEDYLLSWTMAVPQWLTHFEYQPVNVRFAYAWDPRTAANGQGWGFDFWGEAFIVGGSVMTVLMAILVTFGFRFLFVRSRMTGGTGFWGAYVITSAYYALWFQRNGVAYLFKEFILNQTVILLFLIGLVSLILRSRSRTGAVAMAYRFRDLQSLQKADGR